MENDNLVTLYRATCDTLDFITDKWAALVIAGLADEACRYGKLKRRVGDISDKMLSQTLRRLEERGLVSRVVHPAVPPQVEYMLTPLGQSLVPLLRALVEWAELYADGFANSALVSASSSTPD